MKKQKCKLLCLLVAVVVLLSACLDGQDEVSRGEQSSVASDAQLADDSSSLADDTDEPSESSPSSEEISAESHEDESSEDENSNVEYQEEITEEMATAFLKFAGYDCTLEEYAKLMMIEDTFDYKNSYRAFGNLNGYTFCRITGLSGFLQTMLSEYTAGDYVFMSGNRHNPSVIAMYLYKDLEFITFEDAYEQGLFDPADAYELLKNDTDFKDCVKRADEVSPDITFDDMVNIFLKYTGLDCTIQEEMAQSSLTEDWFEKWYVAYGELNGYVLCRMQNFIANCAIWECAAGEYLFISGSNYYPSGIGLYLYKDETFIPFEDSEGLVDPADAYELINSYTGPAPYDPIEVVKLSELSEEKAEYCRKHQYWDFYPSK